MDDGFQYSPRFVDIRVKPPRPEEEGPEDVLRLKPGETPCEWPGCRRAATARAPKSRDLPGDFYQFCQAHAAEYNKNWDFFAGMSEAQIRYHQELELTTGGRPTWQMKAGRFSREAAAFAAKFGGAHNQGAGSWTDAFDLFGAGRRAAQPEAEAETGPRIGRMERQALADLDLEPGVDKAKVRMRYHDLLKRCHPDLNGGDRGAEEKLRRVLQAWKTLKAAGLA